ncbi:polyprenol dehydrogenase-like isoform X3 [Chironomus tepperi]|uniref:polyprenol dehydrogenase-like isoform X3 n=1 Tax=Chironomus tepperi TaxID=113505 RepID=UPI00391FA478
MIFVLLLILFSIIIILLKFLMPHIYQIILFELYSAYICVDTKIKDAIDGPRFNKVSLYSQSSSIAVLTGGNRGIGLEVLKKLLQCEMTVILGVRNIEAARKSIESSIDSSLLMNKVIYENCDTGDMSSVREFAKRVQERCQGINLLINNAGILEVPFKLTKDGFETQMAVNYIGHFLLTHLLMPQLIAGSKESGRISRIVCTSSDSHFAGKIKFDDFNCTKVMAYCDSELAIAMFTKHLHRVCMKNGWNVQPYAAHPGFVNSGLFASSALGFNSLRQSILKTTEQGSRSIVYAAIAPELESNGGAYIFNCRPSKMCKTAMDVVECRKLLLFTCDFLGIKNFGIK